MLSAVLIVVGLVVTLATYRIARQYYALKSFRGPPSAGFTRLWLLWANGSGMMNTVFTEVNDKYGKTQISSSCVRRPCAGVGPSRLCASC